MLKNLVHPYIQSTTVLCDKLIDFAVSLLVALYLCQRAA